jgi:hypothetical protein
MKACRMSEKRKRELIDHVQRTKRSSHPNAHNTLLATSNTILALAIIYTKTKSISKTD